MVYYKGSWRGVGDSALRGMYHVLEPLEFRRPKKIRFFGDASPPSKRSNWFSPFRSRRAPDARSEWKKWPSLPVKAYQRDLKEMDPSVDSLHARDTPIHWIRADLG